MVILAVVGVIQAQEDAYNQSEVSLIDAEYSVSNVMENMRDILDVYDANANSIIPILVPEIKLIQIVDMGRLTFNDLSPEFDSGLMDNLSKHGYKNEYGVVEYPVLIMLDDKHDYIITADGSELAHIKRDEKFYSIYWFTIEYFSNYSYKPSEDEFFKFHQIHNPQRVTGRATLVTPEAAAIIAKAEAAQQQSSGGGGRSMGMSYNNQFQFLDIEKNANDTITLTIAWTNGLSTNMVDFFTCTNLLVQNWRIGVTTNVDVNTNICEWIDADYTNSILGFYDCWTLYDSDSDGLSDGREVRLWKTDRYDSDTDGDALPDGWEAGYGLDPLSTTSTNGALGDADSDGIGNLEEYTRDSDPGSNDGSGTTGTVTTLRYYYDEDDRLKAVFSGTSAAEAFSSSSADNLTSIHSFK